MGECEKNNSLIIAFKNSMNMKDFNFQRLFGGGTGGKFSEF